MTLNSSGPISLAGTTAGVSIEIENGGNGTTMISLNDAAVRSLAGVPSGAIIMPTNFYGKANQFSFTISTNQTNYCLRAAAVTAGWNATSKLVATINSGVYISSNTTATPALTVAGSFPNGVSLINNGTIVGMGGSGGAGQRGTGSAGNGAGTALKVSTALTVTNNNTIAGGGGGGGGSGSWCYNYCSCCPPDWWAGGGGGGGRSSNAANSAGGAGGISLNTHTVGTNGTPGSPGTLSAGGAGGLSGGRSQCYCRGQLNGGTGATWGATGGTGQGSCAIAGGAGGAGGKATCGAGTYITWAVTGTRYGSIS